MMKRFLISIVAFLIVTGAFAQTMQAAISDMTDGRLDKAQVVLEELVAKEPANVEANYWLGQVYLFQASMPGHNPTAWKAKAKEHYTKALAATNQDPVMVVAMGHLDLLDGKNDEAKAKFDAAIAASGNRKNKKYGSPEVLNAIVRANASGDSKVGDAEYAILKAAQSEEILGATPDMFVQLGIIYLKGGGENGGKAKSSFEKALSLDPNYAPVYYRIGRIFESQKNPEMFLGYYEKAINANNKFALAYLSLYEYYANRDVNKAKEYLDLYIANADKDRETDYFYADYLFRSGKYQESLDKGKEIEAVLAGEKFSKLYKLYYFNYDRMGDSIKAMQSMEKYLAEEDPERIGGDDYALMAAAYLRVPGNTAKAEIVAEKAIAADTTVAGRVAIMESLAKAYASQQDWPGNFKWLLRRQSLKPDTTARNYYFLADAAYKAKQYEASVNIASDYIKAYPDQPQGYIFKARAAVAADPDTSLGTAIPAIDEYNSYLLKDTVKNKQRIINNYGYKVYYYLVKSQEYQKALDAATAILTIDPNNDYGQMALAEAQRLLKVTGNKTSSSSSTGGSKSPVASSGSSGNRYP